MSGIAGWIDLGGDRPPPPGTLQTMAAALAHRGPDGEGFLERPGLGLAWRRLALVGPAGEAEPITNEDGTVAVILDGDLTEAPRLRVELEGRGHHLTTAGDAAILPHVYEECGTDLCDRLRGHFAFALWDDRRRRLLLARDRFGSCPLFWTRQTGPDGDWLLFASDIQALFATGLVPVRPDLAGLDDVFTFSALPGPRTCFQGISSLNPGHYLDLRPGRPTITDTKYWEIDFPDRGQEEDGSEPELVQRLEGLLQQAIGRRLRADVPVGAYLSGGVDSGLVASLAGQVLGRPITTFTVRMDAPGLDESAEVADTAHRLGTRPVVLTCDRADIASTYPQLIQAAECPVLDTACASLLLLAEQARAHGCGAVLTGEGADEWMGSYPWFRADRILSWLDVVPGLRLSWRLRRAFLRFSGLQPYPAETVRRTHQALGGHNPWLDAYGLIGQAKFLFYGPALTDLIDGHDPYAELQLNLDRARHWHPYHRGIFMGSRVNLPGLLLHGKGDRVAMRSALRVRQPFLDEDLVDFLVRLHPRWKMRGLRDKYLFRLLAAKWLPRRQVRRNKVLFRAPGDSLFGPGAPAFVDQLLSPNSLRKTGYFNPATVAHWRRAAAGLATYDARRVPVELGLTGVVATQLWHHIFIDPELADLPGCQPLVAAPAPVAALPTK